MKKMRVKKMSNYLQLYKDMANMPPLELAELLAEVLPIGEIRARMDGTVVVVHAYGLRRFQTSTDLKELGIPEDDPRNKVFTTTMQSLVSEAVQNELRNKASRVKKICMDAGAVEVWEGPRKAWWVPVECFDTFTQSVDNYIQEFTNLRDRHLVDQYDTLRREAEDNYINSLKAAYKDLAAGNGYDLSLTNYLDIGLDYFDRRFPSRWDIQNDIRMEMEIVSKSLPPTIRHKVEKLREAEVQAMTAEAAANRALATKETEQMELIQIKKEAEEERLILLKEKRRKQEEILLSQLRPEITQMQEAMERITASTTMLADEIIRSAKRGGVISSAVSKSWNTRLERLRKLSPSNPRLGEAIEALQQLKEDSIGDSRVTWYSIKQAEKRVKDGLAELSTSTVFESFANDIFSLLQNGDREGVLSQIHQARSQHRERLEELENLYEYVVQIMARKEVPV
jgi:hypothetical protein